MEIAVMPKERGVKVPKKFAFSMNLASSENIAGTNMFVKKRFNLQGNRNG